MIKNKRYLFIGITILSLCFGGCGNAMYELTAEEEELIVQSAAYYVAKYNVHQKDGVTNVPPAEESETEVESEEATKSEGSGGTGSSHGVAVGEAVSLAEVIGHESDLQVTYEGSYFATNYVEGDAYSVDATEGNTFYVMKIKITNHTSGDVEVNNAAINSIFKLVNGALSVKSEVTFLTSDFSTYVGTLPAGQSVDTILLFEVSESKAEEISSPELQVIIDNTTRSVKL